MKIKAVIGIGEFKAALDRLHAKVQRSIMGKALRAGARLVRDEAKTLAPERTGALAKSIKVGTGRAKKSGRLIIFAGTRDKFFKGDQFYGGFQEFGWKSGKRNRARSSVAKKIARELEGEARAARKLGPGMGLAAKGTEMRSRQQDYFQRRGWQVAMAGGGTERKQNAGEHYMQYAFEAKGEAAVREVTEVMRQEMDLAIAAEAVRAAKAVK